MIGRHQDSDEGINWRMASDYIARALRATPEERARMLAEVTARREELDVLLAKIDAARHPNKPSNVVQFSKRGAQ